MKKLTDKQIEDLIILIQSVDGGFVNDEEKKRARSAVKFIRDNILTGRKKK